MTDVDFAGLDHRQRQLLEKVLRQRGVDLSRLPVAPRVPEDEPVPLSDAQQRLWVVDRLEPGKAAYNEAYAVDWGAGQEPPVKPGRLAAALTGLVRRHEGLRSRFPAVDEAPVQVVAPPAPVPLPGVDLTALPDSRAGAERQRLSAAEAARPFDLAHGPVVRAMLIHGGPEGHRLLLTLHHIVCDARSLGVVFSELEALYAAAGGEGEPPPEPAVQYPDFAVWQRRWLRGPVLERLVEHWRGALDGYPTALEAPGDRPRGSASAPRAGRVDFTLDEGVARSFSDLARRAGATTFMAYLAAFAVLLGRYTGHERVLIGTAVESRRRPELEGVVGFFANTLVMPVDLTGGPGMATLLRRVRGAAVAAFDHQDLPFVRLVDAVGPERNALDRPLVQVFFVHQRAGQAGLSEAPSGDGTGGGPLPFRPRPLNTGAPKFDLTLAVDEGRDGVRGHLDFDAALFDQVTARRMLDAFQALVASACQQPDQPVAELPLLSRSARRRILGPWRGGDSEAEAAPRVLDEIGRRAADTPDAIAVLATDAGGGRRTLTYRRLTSHATRLAGELRHLGVGPETPVGLIGGRTPETVIGALSILAAGGAYVPLDPDLPPSRRDGLLAGVGAEVTVDATGGDASSSPPPGTVLPVDGSHRGAGDPPSDGWPPFPAPPRQALAYVIHTSGSTGEPKGVMVPHGALDHLTAAFRSGLSLAPEDRLLMVPAPSFDASVGNLFPVLAAGATLVLHPDPATLTAPDLGALVDRLRVTVVDLPAAFWKGWADALEADEAEPPRALRLAISGGESLDPPRVAAWERHTGAALFGPYGPTETTVCATAYLTSPGWRSRVAGDRLPIGRPLPHVRVAVVDETGRPVPAGVTGDLWLGGGAVGRGYLGRPAETALRFRPDPWGAPGARAYHSGDLGRWLADGELEFLGRRDRQLKIRGYRVEPGEVEAQLRRHPGILDTAVSVWSDGPSQQLVAWVVGSGDDAPAAGELSAFLAASLPAHMVPGDFIPLDALPTTSRGKVDLEALPGPEGTGAGGSPTPPRNDLEATLARIWADILGRDEVGVDDDFFRLGGDSILALRLASRAHREGLVVTPKEVFRQRTVARLAPRVQAADTASTAAPETAGPLPLTPIQCWFLDLYGEADPSVLGHWNQALAWDLPADAPTRPGAWHRALAVAVARHDALRLALEPDPSRAAGWRARVRPAAAGGGRGGVPEGTASRFSVVDLSALPAARRAAGWRRAATTAQAALDPVSGPLSRLLLVRGADGPADRLLWTVHHLGVDTVSWSILAEDLETAYRAAAEGGPLTLPPPGTPFAAWARRLETWAETAEPREERDLWRRQTPDDLPLVARDTTGDATEDTGPAAPSVGAAADVERWLDADATGKLVEGLPERFNATPEMALLSALALAFQRHAGHRPLAVELESHGREELFQDLDLSRSVGWFTTAYPLLLDLPRHADAAGALLEVKERMRGVPRGGIGYGVLRWLCADSGGLAGRRRPEVAVNYLGRVGRDAGDRAGDRPDGALLRPSTASPGPLVSPNARRPFPLEVAAALRGGRMWTSWTYNPSLHRRRTVRSLAELTIAALREIGEQTAATADRHHTPSDFPRAGLDRRGLDKLAALVERTDAADTAAGDRE